jgi:hypothetical protein
MTDKQTALDHIADMEEELKDMVADGSEQHEIDHMVNLIAVYKTRYGI